MTTLFHIAFPVHDLAAARSFYRDVLACREGRSSESWIDFDLYGHQIVAHLRHKGASHQPITNQVDGHGVPVPHFGVILHIDEWTDLAERLRRAAVKFVIEPYIRFAGEPGEHGTLFLKDPSGNALEFKGFRDLSQLFAT